MLDFPNSPNPGQQFSAAGVIWTWGGAEWTATGNTINIPDAPSDGQIYGRQYVSGHMSWSLVSGSGGGITDAPNDGTLYGRKSLTWSHLTHSDITDWAASIVQPSSSFPLMNAATAVIGVGTTYARSDHVHPSDTTRLALSGGTLTGPLILAADPTTSLGAATMQYVLANGWHEAPQDSNAYGRLNATWQKVLSLTGGTLTGSLTANGLTITGTTQLAAFIAQSGSVTATIPPTSNDTTVPSTAWVQALVPTFLAAYNIDCGTY